MSYELVDICHEPWYLKGDIHFKIISYGLIGWMHYDVNEERTVGSSCWCKQHLVAICIKHIIVLIKIIDYLF